MRATVKVDRIEIDQALFDFVAREALPGTGVEEHSFWKGFANLVGRLAPRNAELLAKRDRLQALIDAWHRDHPGAHFDARSYRTFLTDIGYLVPEGAAFSVDTAGVDPEIAR
ncbi:MAG TPA: malate synthase G, partial [Steroidobacteraceae bacterium]|nr:malate synthase G [Steroidobacteraceae bacterium]